MQGKLANCYITKAVISIVVYLLNEYVQAPANIQYLVTPDKETLAVLKSAGV